MGSLGSNMKTGLTWGLWFALVISVLATLLVLVRGPELLQEYNTSYIALIGGYLGWNCCRRNRGAPVATVPARCRGDAGGIRRNTPIRFPHCLNTLSARRMGDPVAMDPDSGRSHNGTRRCTGDSDRHSGRRWPRRWLSSSTLSGWVNPGPTARGSMCAIPTPGLSP
jgi:hypothetical protein